MDTSNVSQECKAEVKQRLADATKDEKLTVLASLFKASNANRSSYIKLEEDMGRGASACKPGDVPSQAAFTAIANEKGGYKR